VAAPVDWRDVDAPPREIEVLFHEHHERVFRVAYRVTGSYSDAEDVLQTVFLRLLRLWPAREQPADAGSYLHRAAVNAALDLVRARRAERTVALEEAAELPGGGASPERSHEDRERKERLRRVVAGLPRRAAEMFVLRYFEGRSLAEVARALDTSRGVVAVTLFRARSRLRRELRPRRGGRT
jgi:RNA polymerase sigma-70 factor (ECF subfamily)